MLFGQRMGGLGDDERHHLMPQRAAWTEMCVATLKLVHRPASVDEIVRWHTEIGAQRAPLGDDVVNATVVRLLR